MLRFSLFAALLIATALPGFAQPPAYPIRMGLILPLTGAHAQTASAMRNAALLAMEDLKASLSGRLELVFEDDKLSGANAVSAFTKLATIDRIQAALIFGGQSVASVAPLAAQRHIPTFALTADSSLVRGKPFMFQHWSVASVQAKAVFEELDKTSISRLALVSTTHNAALEILNSFEAEAVKSGRSVVYKKDFAPDETDFRTVMAQIRASKPEAILMVLLAPQMSLFTKQLRAAQINLPIYSSANAEVADEISAAGGAMEGVIYAGPSLDHGFVEHFQRSYGRYPEFAAPHVYDAVKLIGSAIAAGAKSSDEIHQHLLQTNQFHGALGAYGREEHFRFSVHAVPKQIVQGKFVILKYDR